MHLLELTTNLRTVHIVQKFWVGQQTTGRQNT